MGALGATWTVTSLLALALELALIRTLLGQMLRCDFRGHFDFKWPWNSEELH